jgi:hypothetical protein
MFAAQKDRDPSLPPSLPPASADPAAGPKWRATLDEDRDGRVSPDRYVG